MNPASIHDSAWLLPPHLTGQSGATFQVGVEPATEMAETTPPKNI
jgi:hypothetical protein